MIEIKIPKQNASDNEVLVSEIFVGSGDYIEKGTIIFEYETSKANFEFESEDEGYIYFNFSLGSKLEIQTTVGYISKNKLNPSDQNNLFTPLGTGLTTANFTKKALKLMEDYQISQDNFGSGLITEKKVHEYLNQVKKRNFENLKFEENDLVIIGIGGHAAMCIDILKKDNKFNLVGFIDNYINEDLNYNLKYFGTINELERLSSLGLKNVILGIGFSGRLPERDKLYSKLKKNFNIPTILHEKSIVEPSAKIETGCQIMAGAIIGSNVHISENCIINSGSIISHDCSIGRSSHITPGATLAGSVKIGERCTIGMCSTIYIGLSIEDDKTISNGTNVY